MNPPTQGRSRAMPSKAIVGALVAFAISGCHYVKQDMYDTQVAELKSADANLQSQIDALSQKYDTLVREMAGRVRIETGAHFATGDATVGEGDKPFLADFAKALATRPDALVTVEGFADPQGATAYNRDLGKRRAEAVSEFLAANGMSAGQLRTISYGEDKNRQVRPGQVGPAGQDNRRVSLAIDFGGTSSATPMPAQPESAPPAQPAQPESAPPPTPPADEPANNT
jgi:peptidoglycan-associated lipoprotein